MGVGLPLLASLRDNGFDFITRSKGVVSLPSPPNPSPLVAARGSFFWDEVGTVLTEEGRLGQGGLVEDLSGESQRTPAKELGLRRARLGTGLFQEAHLMGTKTASLRSENCVRATFHN